MEWVENNPEKAQALFDKAVEKIRNEKEEKGEDPDAVAANDAVDYALFQWMFGGFNGAGAVFDNRVQIKNLVIHANKMTYEWETAAGFTPWGAANVDDASKALVCAFVKNNAGQWVGGKFDWISTNRTSRDFNHLGTKGEGTGYNGWTLADIPNPTEMAFVIVGWDNGGTGWRSNVLTGTWKR